MCSMIDARLAMIGTAIDELAEAARTQAARTQAGGAQAGRDGAGRDWAGDAEPGTSDTMAERVAGIWAMVADLDPGLAQRLSQYTDQDSGQVPQPTTHD
jgi:hypothetical protein